MHNKGVLNLEENSLETGYRAAGVTDGSREGTDSCFFPESIACRAEVSGPLCWRQTQRRLRTIFSERQSCQPIRIHTCTTG